MEFRAVAVFDGVQEAYGYGLDIAIGCYGVEVVVSARVFLCVGES